MHEAYELLPLLGSQHPASCILSHAGKLFVGTPSGQVAVYSVPDQVAAAAETDGEVSSIASTSGTKQRDEVAIRGQGKNEEQETQRAPTLRLLTVKQVGKKSIEMMAIIKECGMLLLLSDSTVFTLELPLNDTEARPLSSTKGALTFAIDTSVQRLPARQARSQAQQQRPTSMYNNNTLGRAFKPDAGLSSSTSTSSTPYATLRGAGAGASGTSAFDSMRQAGSARMRPGLTGMERLIREKQEKQERDWQERSAGENENVLVSTLAVGCRRRCVIMRWVDGALFDTKEITLPHTPRSLAFPSALSLFMAYTPNSAAIQPIPLALRMDTWQAAREVNSGALQHDPSSNSSQQPAGPSAPASGAVSASGAMAAGFGWGAGALTAFRGSRNPLVRAALDGETMVQKEQLSVFLGPDGSPARREAIEWPGVPDDLVFARPYVLGLLPPQTNQAPTLVIHSGQTLARVQSLSLRAPQLEKNKERGEDVTSGSSVSASASASPTNFVGARAALSSAGPKMTFVSTTEGHLFVLRMKAWKVQVEELIRLRAYGEALATLEGVDEVHLPDKPERKAYVEALWALDLFKARRYDESLEHFLELDVNPCKVVALYPHSVAGNLSRRAEQWDRLFGAPEPELGTVSDHAQIHLGTEKKAGTTSEGAATGAASTEALPVPRARLAGLFSRRPQSLYAASTAASPSATPPLTTPAAATNVTTATATSPVPSPSKWPRHPNASHAGTGAVDDDAKSVRSMRSAKSVKPPVPVASPASASETGSTHDATSAEESRRSLEALGRYLADRRRIFKPLLEAHPSSHDASQRARDSHALLRLPDLPMSSFDVEQLTAIAQTVDTTLFRCFLKVKPALLGSLCRVENWCEVGQVEELLLEKERFSELIALYGGKNMHAKALRLLRNLGEEEEEEEEKTGPTIRYLQNLGPEHVDAILEASHWVLQTNPELGMEIFCADTGKVSELPRHVVVADLEHFDAELCIRYLRHIILELGESDPALHEKLALLLLRRITSSERPEPRSSEDPSHPTASAREGAIEQLASFLELSKQYRAEKILSRLPASEADDDLLHIRALLLGRLGQHESALRIYVYKLADHDRAEEYCRKVWNEATSGSRVGVDWLDTGANQDAQQVFLTLLKLYLRSPGPRDAPIDSESTELATSSASSLAERRGGNLEAALGLISRQGARLDVKAALDLLPQLVPLQDILPFALKTLQVQSGLSAHAKIRRHVLQSRLLQLSEKTMALNARRVRVTEGRTCPRCLKRLGNSVIAVVNTNGAVLHYSCR